MGKPECPEKRKPLFGRSLCHESEDEEGGEKKRRKKVGGGKWVGGRTLVQVFCFVLFCFVLFCFVLFCTLKPVQALARRGDL